MSSPSTTSGLRLERCRERRIADRRPDVGKEPEVLAQAQKPRLRPHVIGHVVPLRPADRTENHGIGALRLRHRLFGDGDLVRVIAGAADEPFLDLETGDAAFCQEPEERLTSAITSGPMPSPGRRRSFGVAMELCLTDEGRKGAGIAKARRWPWQAAPNLGRDRAAFPPNAIAVVLEWRLDVEGHSHANFARPGVASVFFVAGETARADDHPPPKRSPRPRTSSPCSRRT